MLCTMEFPNLRNIGRTGITMAELNEDKEKSGMNWDIMD